MAIVDLLAEAMAETEAEQSALEAPRLVPVIAAVASPPKATGLRQMDVGCVADSLDNAELRAAWGDCGSDESKRKEFFKHVADKRARITRDAKTSPPRDRERSRSAGRGQLSGATAAAEPSPNAS